MGVLSDAVARTLAFVTRRDPPASITPAVRPADPLHSAANSDTSIANVRTYVATGPARTAPTRGDMAGSVPSPADARFRPFVDRRTAGTYPQPGAVATTNTDGRTATPMPYGVQDEPTGEDGKR